MLQSPLVQTWLNNFKPPFLLNRKLTRQAEFTRASTELHAAKEHALENVLGKLTDFGLKKDTPELDSRVAPYLDWMMQNAGILPDYFFIIWMMNMAADFLARAGYAGEPVVKKFIKERLDAVYEFARTGDYNIYVDPKNYRKMSGSFAGRPLINPELTRGQTKLPLVYDVVGWAAYMNECGSKEDWVKADAVIDYILNEKYQQFPWGYGIMDDQKGHYWSMGWSVHLPGFSGSVGGNLENMLRVRRLEQLLPFRAARKHPWIKAGLQHLEQFRTDKGTYVFPREYLQEKPVVYWVVGGRMALEENPRTKKSIEVESTFWMAKFHKALSI